MQILGILETSLKKWGANLILINVGLEGCGITILTRVFEANPLISCTSFIDNDKSYRRQGSDSPAIFFTLPTFSFTFTLDFIFTLTLAYSFDFDLVLTLTYLSLSVSSHYLEDMTPSFPWTSLHTTHQTLMKKTFYHRSNQPLSPE